MPVPENFNVYEVIDMVATQQNNQEVNTGSQNKRVIVSKKAEKLILNDCIRCLLICDKTPEGTGFCQFTLQLKDGKDEIISNNLDDTFVFYGAGETGIDATATYSEGNRTISKTKKNVPAICTFGEKRAPDGGPGSGGVERSCVPIYVDRDTCMKAGYMLYAGLALHAVAWEVSRITTRVGISLTSRALPPLLVRRVSSAMVNCS